MDTGSFLSLFHGDEPVWFRVIGRFKRNIHGRFKDVESWLRAFNDDQFRVYFTVNAGGTKQKDIQAILAVFVDFDGVPKPEVLATLNGLKHPPTIIVESRNGYHAYWILDQPYQGDDRLEMFQSLQEAMNARLGSDPKVKTAERVMAVPGFFNTKDPASLFMVRVESCSGAKYSMDELRTEFPPLEGKGDDAPRTASGSRKNRLVPHKCLEEKKKHPVTCGFTTSPSTAANGNVGYEQMIRSLRRIDLRDHLGTGVDGSLHCPFHADANPSAGVIRGDNGEWLLHCFACAKAWDIINIERHAKVSRFTDALQTLMTQYSLTFAAPSLPTNLTILSTNTIQQQYPNLYRSARWYLKTLLDMNQLALKVFGQQGILDSAGRPLLIRSYRLLARDFGTTDLKGLARKLDNLAWFGLLEKLQDDKIPKHILKQACQHGHGDRRITVWAFPELTSDVLAAADQKALQGRRDGETAVSRSSREAQQRAHGRAQAMRQFPLAGNFLRGGTAKTVRAAAEHLLARKGYVHDQEILEYLGWESAAARRALKKHRVWVYAELGLQPVQTTRALKERLGLHSGGFPKIWMAERSNGPDGAG